MFSLPLLTVPPLLLDDGEIDAFEEDNPVQEVARDVAVLSSLLGRGNDLGATSRNFCFWKSPTCGWKEPFDGSFPDRQSEICCPMVWIYGVAWRYIV